MTVRRLGSVLAVVAGLALILSTQTADGAALSSARGGSVKVGLTGSLTTPEGTWIEVPMEGFWELFLLPAGGSTWSLQTPPGVADNGGLVLAGGSPGSLVVGFRPSQHLKYSPLATTDDGGRTWTPGIFPSALARVPDALAASRSGRLAALSQGSGDAVWTSQGPEASWARLAGLSTIGRTSALKACGPTALTAVAYSTAGTPLVGAACGQPGTAGIFALSPGSPRLVGPQVPGSLGGDRFSVLRLTTTPDGVVALLLAEAGGRSALLATWEQPDGSWGLSPALTIGRAPVASTIIGPGTSLGVLLTGSGPSPVPEMIQGPGFSWAKLPSTPAAARAVAAGSRDEMDAFGTSGNEVDVWRLLPGDRSWTQSQTLKVPIETGSSR